MTAYDNYMFNKCFKLKQQQQRAKVIRNYYSRQNSEKEDNSLNMIISNSERRNANHKQNHE